MSLCSLRSLHRVSVTSSLLLLLLLCLAPSALAQSSSLVAQSLLSASSHTSGYILQPLALAYQLVNPLFSLSNDNAVSTIARASLYAETIDVAFVSATPPASELAVHPNIVVLPYTVVPTVVIYNLGPLDPSVPLLLSPRSLGGIFIGAITWWNDSSIQADNPGLALPEQPITVVLPSGPFATSQILLHTLITQNATLGRYITAAQAPAWPYRSYARYIIVDGADGPSGAVLTELYSIGYSLWAVAQLNGNRISAQLNTAGVALTVSATTVEHGVVEGSTLQIQEVIASTGQQSAALTTLGLSSIDLSAAAGKSSWPMLGMEYVVLDAQFSRTTCHARAGLVDFLVWMLTDASAALVLSENYFGSVPDILLAQLDMVEVLQSDIMCRGTAAASLNIVPSTTVQISVDSYLYSTQLLLAQTYNYNVTANSQSASQLTLSVQANPSSLVFDQQRFLEVGMGLLLAEQVSGSLYEAYVAQQPPTFLLAPLFLVAVAPIYNRQLSANITLPIDQPLNLTSPLITAMLEGRVTSWLDPLILRFNPYLAALIASLPQPQSAPMTQIIPCAAGPTSLLYLARLLLQYPSALVNAESASATFCAAGIPSVPHLLFVTDETKEQGAVQAAVGAFAYTLLTFTIAAMPTVAIAQLLSNVDQWQQTATNRTIDLPFISPTPDSMLACIEGGEAADWQANLANSTASGCWPMTTALVAMLPLSYSINTSSNACETGQFIYDYLVLLYNSSANDAVFHSQQIVRAAQHEPMRQWIDDRVQSATCDGAALLGARPLVWSVSSSVSSFGYALSAIGLAVAVAALLLTAFYIHNAVIAGAQPLLLALHTLGSALLLVSVVVLVESATASSCSFLLWAWNVGSTLTFAPLYCKVYRWYRMYGHNRRVHRVPNLHLYAAVGIALAVDIAFTAAWQARSPLQPQLSITATSEQQTEYVQCGFDSSQPRAAFLVTAAFVKGGALLLFAVMAFTVRRVLISYRENVSVAYSLYNACFALILLIPITVLIAAIGDVLVALVAVLVLWVSVAPLLLLFAPKAAILTGVLGSAGSSAVNPVLSSAKSVSLGFSFLPVAAMSDDVLEAYVKAVEAQLAEAKRRMGGKADDCDAASDAEDEVGQSNRRSINNANGTPADVRRRAASSRPSSEAGSPMLASRSGTGLKR